MSLADTPLRLYCSYSHRDAEFLQELLPHLKSLERRRMIQLWYDRMLPAGEAWQAAIAQELNRADIFLLLISADYLASDSVWTYELPQIIERRDRDHIRVVPIILRPTSWNDSPVGQLQALPKDALPVSQWKDRDMAWKSVVEGIEQIVRQRRGEISEHGEDTLYVSRFQLENIRCFHEVDFNLAPEEQLRDFVLFLGDNGIGKTTLLRSLALGMADETAATRLMSQWAGELLQHGSQEGLIRVEFIGSRVHEVNWIETRVLRSRRKGIIELEQSQSSNFSREKLFVCGYGAARHGFGNRDYPRYAVEDAVGTLFFYDQMLQNPEIALSRMARHGLSVDMLTQRIDAVLMLEPGATRIDTQGIRLRGPWGDFEPLGTLGDGFQATLAWIVDLMGWALLHDPNALYSDLSGVVLLDELEQHLHPRWQRFIVQRLKQQFPALQFLATTHSPICMGGLADLPTDKATVLQLWSEEDQSTHVEEISLLPGWRYDQIITSQAFGLTSARDISTEQLLNQLQDIYDEPDDSPEKAVRLQQAMDMLRQRSINAAEDERERRVQMEITEILQEVKSMLAEERDQ